MNPEYTPPVPHTRVGRWWRRYAGSLAFCLLVIISVSGFYRIEINRYDACQGGNLLREGIRTAEHQRIRQTEATSPRIFNIPPHEFHRLVKKSVAQSEHRIKHLYADRRCGSVWPFRP